jgi:hypothetical protein
MRCVCGGGGHMCPAVHVQPASCLTEATNKNGNMQNIMRVLSMWTDLLGACGDCLTAGGAAGNLCRCNTGHCLRLLYVLLYIC